MTTELAILIFTGGAFGATALAAVFLLLIEMRWRDRMNAERLAAKDRETIARIDGVTDGAADIFRKAKWSSNDDARAALSPE